ncbi:MAG: hypothetical protein RIC38_05980, partial [Chromatocurvus sp.]
LLLNVQSTTSNPIVVELHHLQDDAWLEGVATWNNAPSLTGSTLLDAHAWSPGESNMVLAEWTLPALGVWDWSADIADGAVTFMLKAANDVATSPNRAVSWLTKETSALSAPRLVIDYDPVPVPAALPLLAGALPLLRAAAAMRRRHAAG